MPPKDAARDWKSESVCTDSRGFRPSEVDNTAANGLRRKIFSKW